MPDRPIAVRRRTLQLLFALLVFTLSATGLIHVTDDQAPAPPAAPTSTTTSHPWQAAPQLHDPGHVDLAEPGATQAKRPVASASSASSGSIRGCTTKLNTHNFSGRAGRAVRAIALHYTVSRNIPGIGDVLSVADFLNRPATRASAHFIIDAEGNCLLTVPPDQSAWTEAGGNRFTVGIEFVALGNESQLAPAQLAKGGLVIAQVADRYDIPLQIADVTGCEPHRPGLADHAMYGPCGGGHHDLRPLYGTTIARRPSDDAKVLGPLLAAARANTITSVDRVTCRKLNHWRTHGRKPGKPLANAIRRRNALAGRGVRCLRTGPVRAA